MDFAIVALPAVKFIKVEAGGTLFLTEVLLLAIATFLVVSSPSQFVQRLPRSFVGLLFLWLLSQVMTDLYRETPFEDYSRGWARIAFFIGNVCAIVYILGKDLKRWLLFGVGLSIGDGLTYLIAPVDYAEDEPWKFGVSFCVTFLIILAAQLIDRWRTNVSLILIGIAGLINVVFGFRSLGFICLFCLVVTLLRSNGSSAASSGLRLTKFKKGLIIFGGFGFVLISSILYGMAASSGMLGPVAQMKYEYQSSGEYGVLVGGRTEMLASTQAIADSPLLGHGSWAKDAEYVALVEDRLEELGYKKMGTRNTDQIPTHSYLFGSWVEAGLLGAVVWVWVLRLNCRWLVRIYKGLIVPGPWLVFSSCLLLWNVLFSPFGADQRILAAYQIGLLLFAMNESPSALRMRFLRK